jgi:hypothetical protein
MVIVTEMSNETRPRFEPLSTDLTDEEVFGRLGLVEVSDVVFASVEALDASVALVSASVRRLGTSPPVLRFGEFLQAHQIHVLFASVIIVVDIILVVDIIVILVVDIILVVVVAVVVVILVVVIVVVVVDVFRFALERLEDEVPFGLFRMGKRDVSVYQVRDRGPEGAEGALVTSKNDETELLGIDHLDFLRFAHFEFLRFSHFEVFRFVQGKLFRNDSFGLFRIVNFKLF